MTIGQSVEMTTEPAAAALAYCELGWAGVPVHSMRGRVCSCGRLTCAAPAKHPRVRWQRFETTPPSAAQVASWWRRWPDTNVGVVTGPVSHLVVLDIDPRAGGDRALYAIEEQWGMPAPTVESETGGGGRHLWFRTDDALASTTIAPGCEVKARGGMVVAPPSVHASGGRYRWATGLSPWEIDLAAPPAWVAGLDRPVESEHPAAGPRTPHERDEFAELWASTGVFLRAGDHNYLCPFHDDHHPSLHVDAEGCRWFCFGCRRGGGVGALRRELGLTAPHRGVRRIHATTAQPEEAVTLEGDVEVDVVGESAHQGALLALTGGERSYAGCDVLTVAELMADPRAPLDRGAVDVSIGGHEVGRLRREDARSYRTLLAYTAREHGVVRCRARIVGGWDRGHGDIGAFGVRVVLPLLEDVPPG